MLSALLVGAGAGLAGYIMPQISGLATFLQGNGITNNVFGSALGTAI